MERCLTWLFPGVKSSCPFTIHGLTPTATCCRRLRGSMGRPGVRPRIITQYILLKTTISGERGPALPCGSFEEKQPIVIKDEPRMNTNSHKCRWTHSNEKRRHNASATLLPWYDFVSFVDNPSISIVTPPNPQLINPFIGVHSCPFVVRRFPLE